MSTGFNQAYVNPKTAAAINNTNPTLATSFQYPDSYFMSLQQALRAKDDDDLYAINPMVNDGVRTTVIFQIKVDGEDVMFQLPSTWIPINMTEFAPRASILNSTKFREIVRENKIILINTKDANSLLATPQAKKEIARLAEAKSGTSDYYKSLQKTQEQGQNSTRGGRLSTKPVIPDTDIAFAAPVMKEDGAEIQVVSTTTAMPDIRNEFIQMVENNFAPETMRAIISAHQETMSLIEASYLSEKVTDQPSLEMLYAIIRKAITK